jgi:hypothetical protein
MSWRNLDLAIDCLLSRAKIGGSYDARGACNLLKGGGWMCELMLGHIIEKANVVLK